MTRNAPILFFTFSLKGGGSASIIKTLATHYSKEAEIHVCTMELPQSPWPDGVTLHEIPIKRYRFLGSLGVYLQILYGLHNLMLRLKPGKVVSFIHIANILSVIASWRTGTPVIVCERSDILKSKIGKLWKIIRPFVYSYADKICLQNRNDLNVIPGYLRSKVIFARNPIKPPIRSKEHSHKRIIAVGRLHPVKRYNLLLRIYSSVLESLPESHLHICGEGEQLPELEREIAKLDIGPKVILRGQIEDIPHEFSESDVFVMCSASEGQPNALLEALASGLPAICFDTSPCFQEIGDTFKNLILIRNGDEQGFAKSLVSVVKKDKKSPSDDWIHWNNLAWSEWGNLLSPMRRN